MPDRLTSAPPRPMLPLAASGGVDQRSEQGQVLAGLRMPLHGDARTGRRRSARRPRSCRPGPGGRRSAPSRQPCRCPGGDGSAPRWRRCRGSPPGSRTSPIGTLCSPIVPGVGEWPSWPTTSGRCWISVPPSATFMSCMPRQIAEHRQAALQRRAGTAPARPRPGPAAPPWSCGPACSPYRPGSTSGPPEMIRPSRLAERRLDAGQRAAAARARRRRRPPGRRSSAAAASPAGPRRPSAPARSRR